MEEPKEDQRREDDGEVDEDYDPQTAVVGNWKRVDLPQWVHVTGEQEEQVILRMRVKLYRFRGEWKERGVGQLRLLRHRTSHLIRALVRAEKTHKCILNHLLQKKEIFCTLTPMKTSKNAWTWAALDFSDDQPRSQKICARFLSKEDYDKFQQEFDAACQHNNKTQPYKAEKEEKPKTEGVVETKIEEKVKEQKVEEAKKEEKEKKEEESTSGSNAVIVTKTQG